MNQHEWVLLFIQLSLMSALALLGGFVMRKLHYPSVLGELLGGILLGPSIFGMLAPGFYARVFPNLAVLNAARDVVIATGMLFFLFSTGLEINLARLKGYARTITLTSLLSVMIPFASGYAAVLALPGLWGMSLQTTGFLLPVFIGTALSISALPVIARILTDLNLLDKELGGIIITTAVINDLVGWSLFAAILGALDSSSPNNGIWAKFGLVLAIIFLVWIISRWLIKPFLRWAQQVFNWTGGLIALAATWIFAAAAAAEQLGLHPLLGAFQVGVVFGQSFEIDKKQPAYEIIREFAISFFAPLYFVSVGLKANFVRDFDLLLVIVVLVIACLGKIFGASLGAWLGGMSLKESLAIGSALNARGAIEIILASVALEYQIIDQRIFIALVIMALVTSMLSAPLIRMFMPQPEV